MGKPPNKNNLDITPKGLYGKVLDLDSFGNHSEGFYWNALQLEPYGQRSKRILLEGLTLGILWKTVQKDYVGRPHNSNPSESNPNRFYKGRPHNSDPLDSTPRGFYGKASQLEPFGKHSKGIM